MALSGALTTTLAGLQNTESRINVLANNVTNADKPGYTRKEIQTTYASVNGQTVPLSSTIETVNFNPYLLETIIADSGNVAFFETLNTYMNDFANELGTIDGNNSLSSYTSDLAAALDRLAVTPEDGSLKNNVIAIAERLATNLRQTSESIQAFRLQADTNIGQTVIEINEGVANIERLNEVILIAQVSGQSTANLEDERNTALEDLAKLINIDYFVNNNNEIQIYTGGRPLLDSTPRVIEYTPVTNLDKTVLYPGGFAAIDLNGFDITPFLNQGELGGLVSMRDGFFVEEQAKLDEFAIVLSRELNGVLNTGASIPPRANMLGDVEGLTVGTPLGATGSIRIATTDANGIVQNFADINLVGLLDVGDLITAVNTALGPDVTAGLNVEGRFELQANNAGEGLALNQLSSSFPPSALSFSERFGLNNLYDATGADDITVSSYLINNAEFLATSSLEGGALAINDTGIFAGDSSITTSLNDAFETNYTFTAAGNFAAQTESLSNYIDKVIADTAYRADNAATNETVNRTLLDQTKASLQNISAVNIDEEMANLIDLEAKYEASATMIATIQDMFDALLNAVR